MAQLTETDRIQLAQTIMALFHHWKIPLEQQVTLLGLPAKTRPRFLKRYTEGTPFPDESEILLRSQAFLHIDSALMTTFPHNAGMGKVWMTTPNRRFGNISPLEVMLEHGLDGINQIKCHLDCTENWI